jgi:hypothetical protein
VGGGYPPPDTTSHRAEASGKNNLKISCYLLDSLLYLNYQPKQKGEQNGKLRVRSFYE